MTIPKDSFSKKFDETFNLLRLNSVLTITDRDEDDSTTTKTCSITPKEHPNVLLKLEDNYRNSNYSRYLQCDFFINNEYILSYKSHQRKDSSSGSGNVYINDVKMETSRGLELLSQLDALQIFKQLHAEQTQIRENTLKHEKRFAKEKEDREEQIFLNVLNKIKNKMATPGQPPSYRNKP